MLRSRPEQLARKTLLNRLDESRDLLSERLSQFQAAEFPNLDSAEKDLAIDGVCTGISNADLGISDLIKDQLSSDKLVARIRPESLRHWRAERLSEAATEYGEHYLEVACQYITAIVRELPEFTDEILVQIFNITDKIHELLQRGIATVVMPRFRQGIASEVSAFEAGYLSDIIQTYKDMELFGLTDVPPEFCRQPIDTAYITLQSSLLADIRPPLTPRDPYQMPPPLFPQRDIRPSIKRVDAAFKSVIEANLDTDQRGAKIPNANKGVRILLTGPAGSGKTTVAHWIAVRAAQRRFPDGMTQWNTCTPFMMPLRHIFQGHQRYFPKEKDFTAVSAHRKGNMPGDWLKSRLQRRPLIILDGVDELTDLHKSNFRTWLSTLEHEYPLANIIVTSRPDGLDYKWFKEHRFTHMDLQPMSPPDINFCINAWFASVIEADKRGAARYLKRKELLQLDVERRSAVRELAETPLVCAMLCAFYAYSLSDSAPKSRGDLYQRVINALVHGRGEARGEQGPFADFSLNSKLTLLQALARFFTEPPRQTILCLPLPVEVRPGQWEMPQEDTAKDVLSERLDEMPPMGASVDDILEFLLRRSIVFRRIAPNEAQFVHRSLQEYLAACDYADSGQVHELVGHARQPNWRDILSFAASRLPTNMASRLVSEILDRAEELPKESRELLLLAAQCYGSAGRLTPDVAEKTKRSLVAVLPPKDIAEAELVSYAGEEILPWLADDKELSIDTAVCCMRAAALIGGTSGMSALATYAETRRGARAVIEELLYDWQYFDATDYARNILTNISLDGYVVRLETAPIVTAAGSLHGMRSARSKVPGGLTNFDPWGQLKKLADLDYPDNFDFLTLRGISSLVGLRRLNLSGASRLEDVSEIGELGSIKELYLSGCRNITDIDALAKLKSLRVLVLDGCSGITDFGPISELTHLKSLSLSGCNTTNLSFCARLTELRSLRHQRAMEFTIRQHCSRWRNCDA